MAARLHPLQAFFNPGLAPWPHVLWLWQSRTRSGTGVHVTRGLPMNIYLPIAEVSVNAVLLLGLGGMV
ncbi:MAG: hypothetical protein AAGI70_09920, partial [Pseudomonadota bacterium]